MVLTIIRRTRVEVIGQIIWLNNYGPANGKQLHGAQGIRRRQALRAKKRPPAAHWNELTAAPRRPRRPGSPRQPPRPTSHRAPGASPVRVARGRPLLGLEPPGFAGGCKLPHPSARRLWAPNSKRHRAKPIGQRRKGRAARVAQSGGRGRGGARGGRREAVAFELGGSG